MKIDKIAIEGFSVPPVRGQPEAWGRRSEFDRRGRRPQTTSSYTSSRNLEETEEVEEVLQTDRTEEQPRISTQYRPERRREAACPRSNPYARSSDCVYDSTAQFNLRRLASVVGRRFTATTRRRRNRRRRFWRLTRSWAPRAWLRQRQRRWRK